jgi:FixJ family two-component response regulator
MESTTESPVSTIAVVDDDESILWSLGYLLESAGHVARLFTSAEAFLQSGCLPEIDCLISDIDMPSMDGIALVRRVHELRPGLPTVVVTGYPNTLARLPSVDARALRVFTKPFRGPELLAAVDDAVRHVRR